MLNFSEGILAVTVSRNQGPNWLSLHRLSRQNGIYNRSFRVAMIVGTILNLINQPETMANLVFLDFHGIQQAHVVKAILTYTVPFLVATYGAIAALRLQPEHDDSSR